MKSYSAVPFLGLLEAVAALPGLRTVGTPVKSSSNEKRQAPPFDAQSQYVSTTGLHAFEAPGPLDARGPCPGLNAMANHGYISRTGVATIPEFVTGTHDVFGMNTDLSTILAAYGGLFEGAGVLWSIGGGIHTGIGGSHNNYESDNSPLRADLNQYGSNERLVMSQFNDLYDLQPDASTANYDLDVLKEFRGTRFQQSIERNPDFYYAPFSGVTVTQAAYVFIFRFMGNKSAEYPEGYLNKDVLKSFMSVQGPEDDLAWVPGQERIPDNWYRRNDADLYSISSLSTDAQYILQGQEQIAQPGCNTGTVNSFQPINVTALTSDAYGPADVIANPLCFGLSYATAEALQTLPLGVVGNVLDEIILPIQNTLGCTTIPNLNQSVAQACPGYSLYGGPTGDVAPGAVQT